MPDTRDEIEWTADGTATRVRTTAAITQKEMLLELRDDVRDGRKDITYLRGQMDVLLSQKHDARIEELERWRYKADGRMDLVVRGVPLVSATVSILVGLGGLLALHFTGIV